MASRSHLCPGCTSTLANLSARMQENPLTPRHFTKVNHTTFDTFHEAVKTQCFICLNYWNILGKEIQTILLNNSNVPLTWGGIKYHFDIPIKGGDAIELLLGLLSMVAEDYHYLCFQMRPLPGSQSHERVEFGMLPCPGSLVIFTRCQVRTY